MDKIECMRRFIKVAESGNFSTAADQLGVPKSAVSMSVSKLETHLRTRLFHRSTRRVTLTESGSRYLPECQRILAELDVLESQFQDDSGQLSGDIIVDMPGRLYASMVAPRLHEWFDTHPKTRIRLKGADYRIDPISERVDCVIRAGTLEDSELIAKPLGDFTVVNCVSPSYIERFGKPENLADLQDHFLVDYGFSLQSTSATFEYLKDGRNIEIAMKSLVSVATTDAYLTTCLNGLGIIQVPLHGVKAHLADGSLVSLLEDFTSAPLPLSIVYPSKQHMPKRVREFIDWIGGVLNN